MELLKKKNKFVIIVVNYDYDNNTVIKTIELTNIVIKI